MCKIKTSSVYIILTACLAVGCSIASRNPHPENYDALRRWKEENNYYALLEIVDEYIHPFNNKSSKADVLNYLGRGIDNPGDYPNAGPKMWVYPSLRKATHGSYLIIYFDDFDMVKEIDWASE